MATVLLVLALTATHLLAYAANGLRRDWRAYRAQVAATYTAVPAGPHRADALAWHRRHLPRVLRPLAGLHLPHFHRRAA